MQHTQTSKTGGDNAAFLGVEYIEIAHRSGFSQCHTCREHKRRCFHTAILVESTYTGAFTRQFCNLIGIDSSLNEWQSEG